MARIGRIALLGAAGVGAAAMWWRRNPSACPYNQRFWVQAPHPFITRDRLREALAPESGERLLEIGPGTGYYALPVAEWLGPAGTLELLDVQQDFLDHTTSRAREHGLSNLVPTLADAQAMPYDDATFDGAYLATVLGEIPDRSAALRELRRVVKPGGRRGVRRAVRRPPHGHRGRPAPRGRGRGPELRAALRAAIRVLRAFSRPVAACR